MHTAERRAGETSREYALRSLREKIVDLTLAPGSFVSENELAQELGLSRTPVREALNALARTGIVQVIPQKGSFVTMIDPERVEESRFIRACLEYAVVELCCDRITPADGTELQANVQTQEFYLVHRMPDRLLALEDAFHRTLYEIAGKYQAYQLMKEYSIHFDRVRGMSLNTVRDLKIVEDHKRLMAAILCRDKQEARHVIEVHLARYAFDRSAILHEYRKYFASAGS